MTLRGVDFTGLAYIAVLGAAGFAAWTVYRKFATSGKSVAATVRDMVLPQRFLDSRVMTVHWAPDALALSGDTFASDDADALAFWSNYSGAPLMVETPGGAVTGYARP